MDKGNRHPVQGTGFDAEHVRELLSGMAAGLMLVDGDDRISTMNASAVRTLGADSAGWTGEPVGKTAVGLREVLSSTIEVFRSGRRATTTATAVVGGRPLAAHFSRVSDASGSYAGLVMVFQDLSEEVEFRSHLAHAEKMVVLGELAAAVAHEINNPLGGILESVRIIQSRPCDQEKLSKFLPLIVEGLEQIRRSVRRMLSFSQKHVAEKRPVRIEEVVQQSVAFIGHRARHEQASLDLDVSSKDTCVNGDPHALSQVFVNLINNALDSLAAEGERRVSVRCSRPGDSEVIIEVRDTGCGIALENRQRVFDPFFTTKPTGKGTGLGLSICANIVGEHGGTISLAGAEGGGMVFTVKLPVVPAPRAGQPASDRRRR